MSPSYETPNHQVLDLVELSNLDVMITFSRTLSHSDQKGRPPALSYVCDQIANKRSQTMKHMV